MLFSRHVVPLFSKLGCNAGACHGAVKGQNGFRLSLFGAEPAADHERLLREMGGRRLRCHRNATPPLVRPRASIVLARPPPPAIYEKDAL